MEYKKIQTGGISYLYKLEGTDLYYGIDYTSGDLYEAEELYAMGHEIRKSRVIYVSYPEGIVYEPIKAEDNQYFGTPIYDNGYIYSLMVDFRQKKILIHRITPDMEGIGLEAEIDLPEVKDCYNLMLEKSPVCLCRRGQERDFQVIWPDKGAFTIDDTEELNFRDGDKLLFTKWYEDPYYREESVVRSYPDGAKLDKFRGDIKEMPDGQKWILD